MRKLGSKSFLSEADKVELARMWLDGVRGDAIAETLGIPSYAVSYHRDVLGLPPRKRGCRPGGAGAKGWHIGPTKLTPWPKGMRFIDVWIDELEAEMPRLCTTAAIMRAKRYVTYGFSGPQSSMGDLQ